MCPAIVFLLSWALLCEIFDDRSRHAVKKSGRAARAPSKRYTVVRAFKARCWLQFNWPVCRLVSHRIPPKIGGFGWEKAANCSAICSGFW